MGQLSTGNPSAVVRSRRLFDGYTFLMGRPTVLPLVRLKIFHRSETLSLID